MPTNSLLILHIDFLDESTLSSANLLLQGLPSETPFYLLAPKSIIIECRNLIRKPDHVYPVSLESGFVKRVQEIAQNRPDFDFIFASGNVAPQEKNWFSKLLSKVQAIPQASAIGVKTLSSAQLDINSLGRRVISLFGIQSEYVDLWKDEVDLGQTSLLDKIDSVAGTLCYIRRTAYDAVDGFDDSFCPWKLDPHLSPPWIVFDDFCLRTIVKNHCVTIEPTIGVLYTPRSLPLENDEQQSSVDQTVLRLWKEKWGWNPWYPEPHAIRKKWGETPLCRWIGINLLDTWDTPQPPVDVIVLTHNDLPNLKESLAHFEKSDYPHAAVWILNHACTDETNDFLKKLPSQYRFPVKVVELPINIGVAAANNWMVQATQAPVIAFLDSDAFVPPHWLSQSIETLRRHPYAGIVSVKVVERDQPDIITWSEKRLCDEGSGSTHEIDKGQRDYIARTLISTGCCQVYRRKVFSVAGMYDLHFGPSGISDIEHDLAVRTAGYDILYNGFITVRHSFRKRLKRDMNFFMANRSKIPFKWGNTAAYILDRTLDEYGRRETFPSEP